MSHANFVPLRVFSSFTMLESALEPEKIGKLAAAMHYPAVAVTDRNGLYAAMPFSSACAKAGVQPILGTTIAVLRPGQDGVDRPIIDWLVLLAQDEGGYVNLCRLTSAAHMDRPDVLDAHVTFAQLEEHAVGLICLTAGADGAMARLCANDQMLAATRYLETLMGIFPDRLYIELTRRNDPVEMTAEPLLRALSDRFDLPLVATNPALYATADFHQAHDAMLCIADSTYLESSERRRSNPETWLKTPEAMARLFHDLPEALANSVVVAQRCAFMPMEREPILPNMGSNPDDEALQLRTAAAEGLNKRLSRYSDLSGDDRDAYEDRLAFELATIQKMGFSGYFLIVADFIAWAKDHDIPVGPGRGSGAGSLVAWSLRITDLDPLKLGLLFERFLNPDRVSMPDFDIDFCETRRSEVIRYVQQRYGRTTVAQIITFGTLKARAALKDTGRVLQMSYGQLDRLAKLVPNNPAEAKTLDESLADIPELMREYRGDPQVRMLFDLARQIEGLPRHSSTHAAGVVIGDRPLPELVPLYRDPRSDMPVTQFDMKYCEKAGLVKFDFLGLKTLSVLKEAVRLLALEGVEIDLDTLSWDDPDVYALLQRGDTVGVFQLESEGMRRTLAAVKPTNFGDIIALVSLYRPGPMDNIPAFGARKNGQQIVEYPHPLLSDVLSETYGIFVYQEQVMEAARVLAGYSLGEADLLRRAMGKKIQAEMDAQRARFITGCADKDIGTEKANELFDLIDKFAGYGFNKSHAAAYALLAYQTAWLKAHHPEAFFAASMSYDMHQTDKLAIFVDDMRRTGVGLLGPCINHSRADFALEHRTDGSLAVRYALGALKSVGEAAMDVLVAERDASGPFQSIDDFAKRIDPRHLNRRQLEALVGSGAFEPLCDLRGGLYHIVELLLAVAQESARAKLSGQGGLFGGELMTAPEISIPNTPVWSMSDRLLQEKEAFGFHFSGHPLDAYQSYIKSKKVRSFREICGYAETNSMSRAPASMAAIVENCRWRTSQKGNRYLVATLSDQSGQFQASCFDEDTANALSIFAKTTECVLLGAEIDMAPGDDMLRIGIRSASLLSKITDAAPKHMKMTVTEAVQIDAVARLLRPHKGRGGATIELDLITQTGQHISLSLGSDYALDTSLQARLEQIIGLDHIVCE
jgi:DNA polymerase III subunit alpha